MNKISKKHILVIVLLVVLGAGLVFGVIAGFKALQTKMDLTRVEVLARTDPQAALDALKSSTIVDNDLSAYLSVLAAQDQIELTEAERRTTQKQMELVQARYEELGRQAVALERLL